LQVITDRALGTLGICRSYPEFRCAVFGAVTGFAFGKRFSKSLQWLYTNLFLVPNYQIRILSKLPYFITTPQHSQAAVRKASATMLFHRDK
jgi:hypothetical protein